MTGIIDGRPGECRLLMGNEAMARGALGETGVLPIDTELFGTVISKMMPPEKTKANRQAYECGAKMLRSSGKG